MRRQFIAGLLAFSTLGGIVGTATAARAADEKMWRIGTYLGSAATIYSIAKGEDTWALVGGGATLLSYIQWKRAVKRRHERDSSRARYYRYRRSWLNQHRGRRIVRR
jgi:hypothetical protein